MFVELKISQNREIRTTSRINHSSRVNFRQRESGRSPKEYRLFSLFLAVYVSRCDGSSITLFARLIIYGADFRAFRESTDAHYSHISIGSTSAKSPSWYLYIDGSADASMIATLASIAHDRAHRMSPRDGRTTRLWLPATIPTYFRMKSVFSDRS